MDKYATIAERPIGENWGAIELITHCHMFQAMLFLAAVSVTKKEVQPLMTSL